jgi:8-oxo-dGTP pyrophosphatase MutT (NUDIX family)
MSELKKFSYRRAVFVVVYRIEFGKIFYLLLKRKKHWHGWEFPKGGIEEGEKEIDAVLRECFEETGLRVSKIKNHHVHGKYKYPRGFPDRKGIIGQTYSLYSAEVNDEKVFFDKDEHEGYVWLEYKKALKRLSKQNQKICLGIVNKRVSSF